MTESGASQAVSSSAAVSGLDPEALEAFAARASEGPVRMLNLLKFRPGGAEQYQRYTQATAPLLAKVGGRVAVAGRAAERLIGDRTWDMVLVVEYPTRGALLAMVRSEAYRSVASLRSQALERAVLYALDPMPA